MSIARAKIYLRGMIAGSELLEKEGKQPTNQAIINQCKKALKELKD